MPAKPGERHPLPHQILLGAWSTLFYNLGQFACQSRTAHTSGQNCSFQLMRGNYGMGRVVAAEGLTARLFVQDHAEEATMDLQPSGGPVVIDKTQLPELVHEMTDPRPGGAHHLRQVFLIDSGQNTLGATFLAEMRQQQETPGQTLLAGVEKLVDEILFISETA